MMVAQVTQLTSTWPQLTGMGDPSDSNIVRGVWGFVLTLEKNRSDTVYSLLIAQRIWIPTTHYTSSEIFAPPMSLGSVNHLQLPARSSLWHTLSSHTSHVFLQGPALHLPWSPIWMLLFVAVFRGYCSCLLEDLFFWQGKEFSSYDHNSSLNILKAFQQVRAF